MNVPAYFLCISTWVKLNEILRENVDSTRRMQKKKEKYIYIYITKYDTFFSLKIISLVTDIKNESFRLYKISIKI